MSRRTRAHYVWLVSYGLVVSLALAASAEADGWWATPRPTIERSTSVPAIPIKGPAASFVLDGDGYDGDFGFFRGGDLNRPAQALYLNRFTPDRFPLVLEEIQIFFTCNVFDGTSDGGDCLGNAIDLIVAEDTDGDGTLQTGGHTVAVRSDVVKTIDKVSFSTYALDPPVLLEGPGDVFVGYIPRWIEEGVTGFTVPTTMEVVVPHPARSWGFSWATAPPDPPTFPADESATTTDSAGFLTTFKIRAFGEYTSLGGCSASETTLCLGTTRRFAAQVRYATAEGTGDGRAVSLASLDLADGGIFWFFDPKNPELLVKVLDACAQPIPRFWVFFAATTDVGFELTITDTLSGEQRTYENVAGQRADAVTDTDGFATCEVVTERQGFAWGAE